MEKSVEKKGFESLLKNFVEKQVGNLGRRIVWKIRWKICVEHWMDKLGKQI